MLFKRLGIEDNKAEEVLLNGNLDLHLACKDILGVEYGYPSYAPFITIIAPFFIQLGTVELDPKNNY